jgi:hypothetical protein
MTYVVEMGSGDIIYIQNIMKICTGVEGMLRFLHNSLRGCNICIIDERMSEVRR